MTTYRAFNHQVAAYLDRPHQRIPETAIQSPANWRGRDLRQREADWTVALDDAGVAELAAAGRVALGRSASLAEMTRTRFPLPTLGPTVSAIGATVSKDRGFVL